MKNVQSYSKLELFSKKSKIWNWNYLDDDEEFKKMWKNKFIANWIYLHDDKDLKKYKRKTV